MTLSFLKIVGVAMVEEPNVLAKVQLAFNRSHSMPRVLVAQSMAGREGLNLHRACCHVLLLHPEWNPGVVEQQIGRIDRVCSPAVSRSQ